MSTWEPDPDAPLTDGCRIRIGDGPHEGEWEPYQHPPAYRGALITDKKYLRIPHGCPLTVLREVVPEREWQTGDRVEDARGQVGVRTAGNTWLVTGYAYQLMGTEFVPLTLLVPAEDQS